MKEKFTIKRISNGRHQWFSSDESFSFYLIDAKQFDTYKDAQDNIEVVHHLYGSPGAAYQIDKIFVP